MRLIKSNPPVPRRLRRKSLCASSAGKNRGTSVWRALNGWIHSEFWVSPALFPERRVDFLWNVKFSTVPNRLLLHDRLIFEPPFSSHQGKPFLRLKSINFSVFQNKFESLYLTTLGFRPPVFQKKRRTFEPSVCRFLENDTQRQKNKRIGTSQTA